jgi:hypothetical protein
MAWMSGNYKLWRNLWVWPSVPHDGDAAPQPDARMARRKRWQCARKWTVASVVQIAGWERVSSQASGNAIDTEHSHICQGEVLA